MDTLDIIDEMSLDPVVPAAYTAHAPFSAPPNDMIPSSNEMVEGLMTSFEVPDGHGELHVLIQMDPKFPPKTLKQAMGTKYA